MEKDRVRHRAIGRAWELFAIMDDDGRCVGLFAKDPERPTVVDVTDDVRKLVDHPAAGSTATPKPGAITP